MDPKLQRVVDAGRAVGLQVDPTTFSVETRTAADAAREIGCEVAQIVKSLVFSSEKGPLLFLVSGANRLDASTGAVVAGVTRLEKADAAGVKAATGFSIGATPPLGLSSELPVFIDEDLLGHDVVWAAAGRPDSVFPLTPGELVRATGGTVAGLKEG